MTRDQLKYNCSRWHHEIISLMSLWALSSDKDARIKEDNDTSNINEVHREIKLTVYSPCKSYNLSCFNVLVMLNQKYSATTIFEYTYIIFQSQYLITIKRYYVTLIMIQRKCNIDTSLKFHLICRLKVKTTACQQKCLHKIFVHLNNAKEMIACHR